MKKLIGTFAVLVVLLTGVCVIGAVTLNDKIQEHTIVVENGWSVVKDNNPNQSTIVASVTSDDLDGDGYVIVTNDYDKNDTVAIDKSDLKLGDKVLVTFDNDDVVKVSKR